MNIHANNQASSRLCFRMETISRDQACSIISIYIHKGAGSIRRTPPLLAELRQGFLQRSIQVSWLQQLVASFDAFIGISWGSKGTNCSMEDEKNSPESVAARDDSTAEEEPAVSSPISGVQSAPQGSNGPEYKRSASGSDWTLDATEAEEGEPAPEVHLVTLLEAVESGSLEQLRAGIDRCADLEETSSTLEDTPL